MLTICGSNGQVERAEMCSFGCAMSGDNCQNLDPSNGLGGELDGATTSPSVLLEPSTATTTIDTDTGEVLHGGAALTIPSAIKIQAGLPNIRIFQVKSLVVRNPVKVSGAAALAIVSDGDVEIASTITIAGRGRSPGPGSIFDPAAGCAGRSTTIVNTQAPGPGGAGFAARGGVGGSLSSAAGGSAGMPVGTDTLEPLRGGCVGGAVIDGTTPINHRGGGGGALQVSSRNRIMVTAGGVIDAGGGGGAAVFYPGGGGSGGGILLEAAEVTVNGTLVANGGGGGSSAGMGEDGRTAPRTTPPVGLSARGGVSSQTAYGSGGDGGSREGGAKNGNAAVETSGFITGGGGGGGVGRVRVNTRTGTFIQTGSLISPEASQGTARIR